MKRYQRSLIALTLAGLALVSGLSGGLLGYRAGRQAARDQANPETWHEEASRRFERVVRPTEEQGRRLHAHLQQALGELRAIRHDTITRSSAVIDRLVARIEAELTPEQKAAFERLKPRPGELGLEVLETEK